MGVIYIVQPLTPEVTSWLEELGIAYDADASSRNPTGQEIHDILAELTDYQTQIIGGIQDENWEAHLSDRAEENWTCLSILKYQGLEKENELTFHKGHPALILAIVHRLSKHTGPLILIPDTGENPAVVSNGDSLENLLAEWEHTRDVGDG